MTVQRFVATMLFTTAICWAAVLVIFWNVDPTVAPSTGFLLLYIALFFASWGTVSMLGVGVRKLIWKTVPPFSYVGTALRQALWFALLLCLTLFLLSQRLFDWWMSIPLIIGFVSIEGFFLSKTVQTRPQAHRMNRQIHHEEHSEQL